MSIPVNDRIYYGCRAVGQQAWSQINQQSRPSQEIDRIIYEEITQAVYIDIITMVLGNLNHPIDERQWN
jgi:hypothetical protein